MAARADRITRTLGELAAAVGGAVRGDPSRVISGVNGLSEAGPGEITFFNNARYRDALKATRAAAVIVREDGAGLVEGREALVAADPYLACAKISAIFHPRPEFAPGIDPRAVIEPGARVDPSATVMAFAFVGRDATVGPRSVLFPSVFVGEGASIGSDCLVYPHVVVREGCRVGDRAILQPGVVIGGDGFGFAFDGERKEHFKIPQAGIVEIGADVEIGANSAVDRATSGKTVVGQGAKIDNLVQVGHNVQIGPLCILCGQVGLAGSSKLGAGVVCGGQSGVSNHVSVAPGTRIGAQSGVMDDVAEKGEYIGSPAIPGIAFGRAHVAYREGPKTRTEVRRLEKRVAELEGKLEALLKKV